MATLAQQLKDETAAVSFKSHKFGVRRRLDQETRAQAACPFGADPSRLVASKCLLDTRAEPYRQVTSVITRARRYWKSMTVFYPVKGVRLIRRDLVAGFDAQMKVFQTELKSATDALLDAYKTLKTQARHDLGTLFASKDYPDPETLLDEFTLTWGYPSVEPPNFLKELNPRLYEQEQARVAARFEEAMAAAEQALAAEMQDLIGHLVDRLSPAEGGPKRALNEKALAGLSEFVARFRQLSVSTSPQLEAMVKQAEQIAKGVDVAALKANPDAQQHLFGTMSTLKEQLDSMLVDVPDRKIDLED